MDGTAQPTPGCRVLVVDDDEDTCDGMAELLRAAGHDVRVAADGPAAVDAAIVFRPLVVVTDIGLPMMNGYELATKIRARGDLAGVVLVAITGYGHDKDRERTRAAGFDHHLVKPPDPDEVLRIVAQAASGLTGGGTR